MGMVAQGIEKSLALVGRLLMEHIHLGTNHNHGNNGWIDELPISSLQVQWMRTMDEKKNCGRWFPVQGKCDELCT